MFSSVMGSRPAPDSTSLPGGIQAATAARIGSNGANARTEGANGTGHALSGIAEGSAHAANGSATHLGTGVAPEGKRLIVGPGISLSGEITACDRLVVQGSVQVTLNETRAIEIAEAGRFTNGKAEVEEAEVSGTYEGELTVRRRLLIRGTGRVTGKIRYGELEIERGGLLSGEVSRLVSKVAEAKAPKAAAAGNGA